MAIGELSKLAWKGESSYPLRDTTAPSLSSFEKRIEVGEFEGGTKIDFVKRETLVGAKTPLPQVRGTQEGEFKMGKIPLVRKGGLIPLFKYVMGTYECLRAYPVVNEILTSNATGGETSFTLSKYPVIPNTLILIKNNEILSSDDYTIDERTGEITLNDSLSAGDKLLAWVYFVTSFGSTATTSLASAASQGDTIIAVNDVSDLHVGDYILIGSAPRVYKITDISGVNLTISPSLASAQDTGASVYTVDLNVYSHRFYAGNEDLESFSILLQESNLGLRALVGCKVDSIKMDIDTGKYWEMEIDGKYKKDFIYNSGEFPNLELDIIEPFKFDQSGLYINGEYVPEAEKFELSLKNNLAIKRTLSFDATPNNLTSQAQDVEISFTYEVAESNYGWYNDYLNQNTLRLILHTGKENTEEITSNIPYQFLILAPECRWAEKNTPKLGKGRLMVDGKINVAYNDKVGKAIEIIFINDEPAYF